MGKLGVAIQGTGASGISHGNYINKHPDAEVRVMNSCSGRALEEVKRKLKFDCEVTTRAYEEMVHREDIDVVVLCSINNRHPREAILAAEAGKHILIEKPVATTLPDMRAMRDAVHKAGVKTFVSFIARFYPIMRSIKRILQEGLIGPLYFGAADYKHEVRGAWKTDPEKAGSALIHCGCHAVDILRWFMEEEQGRIVEVHAYSCSPRRRTDFRYDPTIIVNCRFESGAIGRVSTSFECNMPYVFNVELEGTEGTIRNDSLFSAKLDMNAFAPIPAEKLGSVQGGITALERTIDHFLRCILEDKRPSPDLDDACLTHEICFAADLSAHEGRPVRLPLPE